MASEAELAGLIQLGRDLTAFKIYLVSATALPVYDYLLTLKDEIRYAWKPGRVLVFVLFLFTRYLPIAFQVWGIILAWDPGYTSGMCNKTAFLQVMYYTFITAFAQIVLTQRVYAITGRNKWIAGSLYTICVAQFGVGVYMFVCAALKPAVELPPIPLDAYDLCLATIKTAFTITQVTFCLVFDTVAFVLIIVRAQTTKSMYRGMKGPNILDTVSKDAWIYFAVISTYHCLTVIMYLAARPGIRPIPIVGNMVLIPMMISRMIISLKKAASSRQSYSSMDLPTRLPVDTQNVPPTRAVDNVQLTALEK